MKRILLTFLGMIALDAAAQRNIDLQLELLAPEDNAQIVTMNAFPIDIEFTNLSTEPLLATDSLAVYVIMNGDTVNQGGGLNYWIHTNIPLAQQQTYVLHKMMAFDVSMAGAHVDFCIFAKPYSKSNPVADDALANNMDCKGLDVVSEEDPTSGVDELAADPVTVYPNPVNDKLFLLGKDITDVVITDNTGKVVIERAVQLDMIDCSDLKSGIYFVKVKNASGVSVQRIVVER